ncbi:unnamed protein product [Prunus brigantina]
MQASNFEQAHMSIALDRNGGGDNMIQRPRFIRGMPCLSMYDSSENKGFAQHRRLEQDLDSCSSSSVGRNSDSSNGSSEGDDSGEAEIQSSYKGPLDTMDQLEEVLPVKRGISMFYSGKSKSFTSLEDVSSVSSVKDLAKPKNRFMKKRKNLLAHSNDRNCNNPLKNNGAVKRPTANSSRGSFLLGENLSSSISPPPTSCLPPLHPPLHPDSKRSPGNGSSPPPLRRNSPWRSFSLSDLQCVAAATPNITGLEI